VRFAEAEGADGTGRVREQSVEGRRVDREVEVDATEVQVGQVREETHELRRS
jgi:hypothetical protein